jgi:hypothetical protein
MKPTKDSKMGGVKKMQSYEPGEMKEVANPMKDGHHKLSGSLLGELRGEGSDMEESMESEADEAAEMENVMGQKKGQKKSSQDYTRLNSGSKQGPNKIKGMKNGKGY